MLKLLHCADIHLDSPFSSLDAGRAEVRRNELRGAFTSMMLYAKMNAADLILIAGDFFDTEYVTKETTALILREFEAVPNIAVVIAPGNHDPYAENSVYARAEFPDNVYIFDSPALSYFSFDELGADVYGYAFTSPVMERCPFAGKRPADPGRVNILCAHGDMTSPISKKCPITRADLEESGFDYAALGHIHNSQGADRAGKTTFAYSGCIEGRDYGETGYKGAFWVEIDGGEVKTRGLRFSKRRYETMMLDITGASSAGEAAAALKREITAKGYGSDTSLRVTLEGSTSPSLVLSPRALREQLTGLFELDIRDKTLPLYDYEYLNNDPTIRGAFFAEMLPLLSSGTPAERELAAKALRYGLSAISGGDIIDF